jgi:intracellular sulfur oxidation DsrE/DsrF family protein
MKILLSIALTLLTTTSSASTAGSQVDEILKLEQEPEGVVFEIVTGKDDGLEWALPLTKGYIDKLKKRFPQMPVAIVTHGREQFALQKSKEDKNAKVHGLTQQLVRDGVNLHVCGAYAGWKGLSEEDFPEYVNVSAAGPAQINDYIAVGYLKVKIKKPD